MTRDPHTRLGRLLRERAGTDAALIRSSASSWQSVTFSGMRHLFLLETTPAAADALAALSAADDIAVPGHLCADLSLADRQAQGGRVFVEVAALTLERG